MPHLVLASASPRVKVLLTLLNIKFTTIGPLFEPVVDLTLSAEELARQNALAAARSVADDDPDAVVVGADTFVTFEERTFGKSHSDDDARAALTDLSGRTCTVVTGYAVVSKEAGEFAEVIETAVHVRALSEHDIDGYIGSGEHLGKAAGLGLPVIEHIDGDKSAVLGLPLRQLADVLALHLTIGTQSN